MRIIFSPLILVLAAASVQADAITLLSETRSVSVWLQAQNPLALSAHDGTTNRSRAPFNDPHLNANGNIGWQEVNGWTAHPRWGRRCRTP